MKSYRKNPIVIEAWQLNRENCHEIYDWINQGIDYRNEEGHIDCWSPGLGKNDVCYIDIITLEGIMKATEGDYIIKGIKGEFYPCKEDIFLETYEEEWE